MDNLVNIGIPTAAGALAAVGATATGASLPQVLGYSKCNTVPHTKRVLMKNHACTQHTMPIPLCLPTTRCGDDVVVFSGLQYQACSQEIPRGEGCFKP
jgi:hypothetical protein